VSELNVVFAGSPDFAASILNNLIDSPFKPQAVFTQPDRPSGRGRKLQANPVKALALEHNLPVEQPASLKDSAARQSLSAYQPDVFVVAAYGLLLPKGGLNIPRIGCLNVHASLLPRWRGAAPIERAAIAGDATTGVCIMHMERGLDTGPVYQATSVPINYNGTVGELEAELAETGSHSLLQVLTAFAQARSAGTPAPTAVAQDERLATYADKLTAPDRQLNWQKSASSLARQIWALAERLPVRVSLAATGVQLLRATVIEQTQLDVHRPEPGTIVDVSKNGVTVQCATDLLQIKSLRLEKGKGSILDPAAVINGFADLFRPGTRFATSDRNS